MSEFENQLFALLKERSFRWGTFRLASGDTSNYYIDGKMTQVYSAGAYVIGQVLYERTKDLTIDAVGGLETGAIPLTTATVVSYYWHGRSMEGFWVRDKIKEHGTQKAIEGNLRAGARVVLVDDVITRGSSLVKAAEEVRKIGCEVVQAIALVDRLAGAAELFRKHGIADYRPVFTIKDFGVQIGRDLSLPSTRQV
jgi:orotate phosphoribosyltransferase